jgi:hypothetical protein
MTTHRVVPRAEWGAIHPNGAGPAPVPADEVWLHHSVTIAPDLVPPFSDDYAAVRTLERIGQARFGAGISYTFPITPAGLIFEGHSVNRRGAHTAGHNTHGRAICFVGNYEVAPPTAEMIDAAGWLLAHGFLSGWWDAAELQGGHRDIKGTACPGRYAYAAMSRIDAAASAYVRGVTSPHHQEDDDVKPTQWDERDRTTVRNLAFQGVKPTEWDDDDRTTIRNLVEQVVTGDDAKTVQRNILKQEVSKFAGALQAEGVTGITETQVEAAMKRVFADAGDAD